MQRLQGISWHRTPDMTPSSWPIWPDPGRLGSMPKLVDLDQPLVPTTLLRLAFQDGWRTASS
jgi:hypothetical protein